MTVLIISINWFSQLLVLLVLAHVILSYFMSPYHPVRMTVDRLVNPLLDPIRRVIPSIGMLDFSPVVLIILVQLVSSSLIKLLTMLR
jgi:YggT family protein